MRPWVELCRFLMDLHRHRVTTGASLAFGFSGLLLALEGVEMISGSFVRSLAIEERAWWQWVYPPPLPTPFNTIVRAFYVLIGTVLSAIGLSFSLELFVILA